MNAADGRGGASGLWVRAGRAVLVGGLAALAVGCGRPGGSLPRPSPETLPPLSPLRSETLSDVDAWARHHLMVGEYGDALHVLTRSRVAPRDRLLRSLQEGVVLHRAGEYARSNEVLEWAEIEADRRYTRSVSRGLASLALSDRALAYLPSAGEMALIPFYRMINYLALGDSDGALVEARKANALLARLNEDAHRRCRAEGMVHYLAGLVQGAAGERNDALVSLRQAEAAFGACGEGAEVRPPASIGADLYRAARALGVGEVADSVRARYGLPDGGGGAGSGDLLLVIEQGFVSHRAPSALHVPVYPEDVDGVEGDDSDQVIVAAGRVTERLLQNLSERAYWGEARDDQPWMQWAHALEGAYVLRLAWPVARRDPLAPDEVRVFVGDSLASVTTIGAISPLVEDALEDQRPGMLSRLVARGLTKYLVTREVGEKAEDEAGELAGFVVSRLTNLAANELERADTRSWSLLPDRISLARLRLPEGEHRVRIETVAADGSVLSVEDLGTVRVVPGRLVAVSRRVWGG